MIYFKYFFFLYFFFFFFFPRKLHLSFPANCLQTFHANFLGRIRPTWNIRPYFWENVINLPSVESAQSANGWMSIHNVCYMEKHDQVLFCNTMFPTAVNNNQTTCRTNDPNNMHDHQTDLYQHVKFQESSFHTFFSYYRTQNVWQHYR